LIGAFLAAAALAWHSNPPLPVARTEVAGANWRGDVVVVGGFTADGRSSARVDAYSPRSRRWVRLPDLPLAVNHTMATAGGGRLYVVGGYAVGETGPVRDAFVLLGAHWRRLRPLPYARAAGGAAFIGGTLYVAGGVGPYGTARSMEAYDVAHKRWRVLNGPLRASISASRRWAAGSTWLPVASTGSRCRSCSGGRRRRGAGSNSHPSPSPEARLLRASPTA
jgi:N-acetylneuraminic acid mutarotase